MFTKRVWGILLISATILLIFLLSSCTFQRPNLVSPDEQLPRYEVLPKHQPEGPSSEKEISKSAINESPSLNACKLSAECSEGKECIDERCDTLTEKFARMGSLSSSPCEKKCTLQKVYLKTSDGEEYSLPPGQGSYSYAGALEWKILASPSQCQQLNALVPFQFISKTTGKILGEEVVTVPAGFKSKVVTHPAIPRIAFTVEVTKVDKECS